VGCDLAGQIDVQLLPSVTAGILVRTKIGTFWRFDARRFFCARMDGEWD
jgi:hypothetical protein